MHVLYRMFADILYIANSLQETHESGAG